MRFKNLLLTTVVVVSVFMLSSMAFAEAISWTTQQYRAYADVAYPSEESYAIDEKFGPPLPLSAQAEIWSIRAFSNVSDSTISAGFIDLVTAGLDYARATGSFSGTYNAVFPYFQFYYDYTLSQYISLSLNVTDSTTGASLYDWSISGAIYPNVLQDTDTIYVATPVGHDISTALSVNAIKGITPPATFSGNVSYGMAAVVPEPISSILFVTGGALLAGRRFLRRKKKV